MPFNLPPLPFEPNSLAPILSAETIEYHYGKHHKTYVDKLNGLIENTEFKSKTLEEIIKTSEGGIFNNAAQVWNHSFYWNGLSPKSGGEPQGRIAKQLQVYFGSFAKFKEDFSNAAKNFFGSGWIWLVKEADGRLSIKPTANAQTPLTSNQKALLTIDVWEHAYYIDYRNVRATYVDKFWNIVNWEHVNQQLG